MYLAPALQREKRVREMEGGSVTVSAEGGGESRDPEKTTAKIGPLLILIPCRGFLISCLFLLWIMHHQLVTYNGVEKH